MSSPSRFRQADAIFDAALDLDTVERAAFVDRACEGDAALRAVVMRLLRAHDGSGGFLARRALELAQPLLDAAEAAPSREPLPARVGPYVIQRELGRGGMGVVYLARHENEPLGQAVALKVGRSGARVSGVELRRFLAERRIVASLDHPNVARHIDAGITSDGTPWFVMWHCAGGSLQDRLAQGPVPLADALRIARELADGLGSAHSLGIVHRDVKPGNILFDGAGKVQLTDFGIAKRLDQESTQSGSLLGTPSYLAPEQLRGSGIDHRADLWAVGVTLYQMVSGRRPFDGPSYAAILHGVVAVDPPRLMDIAGGVPQAVDALVHHLLQKDRDQRPVSAAAVVSAIREIEIDPTWVYEAPVFAQITPTPSLSARIAAASVVVLPFTNTSGNPDDTPFSDGLTDEVISMLGRVRSIRVTARTTAFALRGKGLDARSVANILSVTYVLEGTVRRAGERLKVAAQLVRAGSAEVVWAESYDRRLEDVFAVQEDLARAIVQAIAPTLAQDDVLAAPPVRDLATYELYLKGRYFWEKRAEPEVRRAAEYYEQAIGRDPGYADAHAGRADCGIILVMLCSASPAVELPRARVAIGEALRLGPGQSNVLATHGNWLTAVEWRWTEAEQELRTALTLNPGNINARNYLTILLQHLGRFEEAIDMGTRALVLDPLSTPINLSLGRAYLHAGRPADAVGPLRTAIEIASGFAFARQQLGYALLDLGNTREALESFTRGVAVGGPSEVGALAFGLAATGDRSGAEALLGQLLAREGNAYLPPISVAVAYAGLADADAAFAWLDRGYEERAAYMNTLKVAPPFRNLHGDRRWRELLRRLQLDDPRG